MSDRHAEAGVLEITLLSTNMVFAIPTLKYWINVNPMVYKLRERFVTQITTSMYPPSEQSL